MMNRFRFLTIGCSLLLIGGTWPANALESGPPPPAETELVPPGEMEGDTPPSPRREQAREAMRDAPDRPRQRQRQRGRMGGRPDLSPEERQQLVGALRKALRNKNVREAQQELGEASKNFEDTITEAILADDPDLAPLMEKMQGMMAAMMVARTGCARQQGAGSLARPNRLPGSESASDQRPQRRPDPAIMRDPDVIEARKAVEEATSRPERISAFKRLRQAVEDAKAKQSQQEQSPAPEPADASGN